MVQWQSFTAHVVEPGAATNSETATGDRPVRSGSGLELMLAAVLDTLAIAVFLVEPSGRLLHVNCAADRLIRRGRALRIVNRRLTAYAEDTGAALDAALAQLNDPRQPRCRGLALPEGDGGGLIAAVVRLNDEATVMAGGRFGHAMALGAVLALDPTMPRKTFNAAFGALYGLTGCELRVAKAIAEGSTKTEISAAIGSAPSTVSTHLARAFDKTRTSRQTELAALFLKAMPPLLDTSTSLEPIADLDGPAAGR